MGLLTKWYLKAGLKNYGIQWSEQATGLNNHVTRTIKFADTKSLVFRHLATVK